MVQKLAVMLQQRELRDKKRKQKHKNKRRRELRDKKGNRRTREETIEEKNNENERASINPKARMERGDADYRGRKIPRTKH
jgi:hypothetical protein